MTPTKTPNSSMIDPADYEAAHAETVEDAIEQEQAEQRRVKLLREAIKTLRSIAPAECQQLIHLIEKVAK